MTCNLLHKLNKKGRYLLSGLPKIVNFVLPFRCSACYELVAEGDSLCSSCFSKLDFIAKPYCAICGFPFDFEIEGQFKCGDCIVVEPKYDLGRSLFKFDPHSKKIIHNFKYNDHTGSSKLFSKLIYSRYKSDFEDVDYICPVPMNRFKRIFRYYNPPQILGESLSRLLKIKQIPDLLIKTKLTKPQASLAKAERLNNVKGSIKFNKSYDIKGKVILLVDDVKTTGTTSNVCCMLLKKAGASSVKLVTIAIT